MVIETAIVAPVLVLLAIGSFQVSMMVARQTEMQNAAAEAAAIALASPPESQSDLDTVADVMRVSASLDEDEVGVSLAYRCGTANTRVTDPDSCSASDRVWTYMLISLSSTYSPIWTKLGIGSDVALQVDRAVQIS